MPVGGPFLAEERDQLDTSAVASFVSVDGRPRLEIAGNDLNGKASKSVTLPRRRPVSLEGNILTTLTFTGTDFRGLLDLLIEAVKLDERPSMVVNGKTYAPFELLRVADLLPDDDLLPHHQSIVDGMFTKRQHGYQRTAYNLAHRANAMTIYATVGETIQRHMRQKFREQKRIATVAELIPSELLSKIKKWAKDNNCLPTDAIVRLIGLGLHVSKAEKAVPRKAKQPIEGVAVTVPGLLMTSIRSDAAAGEGSLDGCLDVNACGVE